MCGKKFSILYKQKPCGVNIGAYSTVIFKFLKSNMNLQFVTGVYAASTYKERTYENGIKGGLWKRY